LVSLSSSWPLPATISSTPCIASVGPTIVSGYQLAISQMCRSSGHVDRQRQLSHPSSVPPRSMANAPSPSGWMREKSWGVARGPHVLSWASKGMKYHTETGTNHLAPHISAFSRLKRIFKHGTLLNPIKLILVLNCIAIGPPSTKLSV
jgi:hypothetical protein